MEKVLFKILKIKVLILILILVVPKGFSQNEKDTILLVGVMAHDPSYEDVEITSFFQRMIKDIKKDNPDFPFTTVHKLELTYKSDFSRHVNKAFIVTLTPLKYAIEKNKNKEKIKAIFISKKRNEQIPYYPAVFITNKNSNIKNLYSNDIKNFYYVENSASAFLAPLHKLYKLGIIKEPTLEGIRDIGWNPIELDGHKDIEEEIKEDTIIGNSIGSVWHFDNWNKPSSTSVRVLLRYDCLPQDPIVISKQLYEKYGDDIKKWFLKEFKNKPENCKRFMSIAKITGIEEFVEEHENAFNDLYKKYEDSCIEPRPEHRSIFYSIIKWSVPLFYITLFTMICVFVVKYKRTTDISKKKKYSTYTSVSFIAILLTSLEYIRVFFEWLADIISSHKDSEPFIRLLIVLVTILIAFFVEQNKGKLANCLYAFLEKIKKFINTLEDMFKQE